MIARQAHYSDDHFRRRTGKASISSREQLRGRAVPCLALVNKEMRTICMRWLLMVSLRSRAFLEVDLRFVFARSNRTSSLVKRRILTSSIMSFHLLTSQVTSLHSNSRTESISNESPSLFSTSSHVYQTSIALPFTIKASSPPLVISKSSSSRRIGIAKSSSGKNCSRS